MDLETLLCVLRERLSANDIKGLTGNGPSPDEYHHAVRRVRAKVATMVSQVERNQRLVEEKYESLVDQPEGRRRVLFQNSPPSLLRVLAESLIRQSYEARLSDTDRSLELAKLALECARRLRQLGPPGSLDQIDLEAQAWIYLANARRVNSDLQGAHKAFRKARASLRRGSGDRYLRADYLALLGAFRFSQGRTDEASELFEKEIKLRRLLQDNGRLSAALVNYGVAQAWAGDLEKACDCLSEGVKLADDPNLFMFSLCPLAERLARDGRGLQSWKVLFALETVALLLEDEGHRLRIRWIRGISERAMGEYGTATRYLTTVREQFIADGSTFRAALVSVDLAAVCAARGKASEAKKLAEEAYAVFRAERLEERALSAFLVFYKAAVSKELTEELAVRVANFLARFRHDKSVRFEG